VRICVIFNPTARGEKANRLRKSLAALSSSCALKPTTAAGAGRTLAAEAVREGYDTIVAAGGDGTLNEVLNGIGDEPEGFARARLAVWPTGTVNVFAREIGMPLNLTRAWETILCGRETMIDLPQMEFEMSAQPQRRYFIQMAGAGWDARAVELVSWELKKKIGQFAYMVAGLKALRGPPSKLTVTNGSQAFEGELAIIGNGRFYGGQIPVFRRANLQDGLLDVCVFPKISWSVLSRYCWCFVTQRPFVLRKEKYFQTASLQIESAVRTPFELDGENAGHLPVVCSVRRQALRIVVP
jgi:diacylglycerol kinase (ATP)